MFIASGSGSMLQNPAETKKYKVHASYIKKNGEKQKSKNESLHRLIHHPVPDRSQDYPPIKFKLKINASKGKVEVINTITSEQLSSIRSTVPPKPLKPKKKEKEYLNVCISQDVALENEPVHGGIADSVKTKKRRCKDKGSSAYSSEYCPNTSPQMLMLSPKKRKARKNVETNKSTKKWKSETSLTQESKEREKRKSYEASCELYRRIVSPPILSCSPPTLNYKRDVSDLTPPFDVIFDMERRLLQKQKCNLVLSQQCNAKSYCLDEVESTVMDPIFKNVTEKFQQSAEMVVCEYLAGGCPDVEEIEKVSFEPVLAEKNCVSEKVFELGASPGNVFLPGITSQELVIASYEDAVEVSMTTESACNSLESPPYGSQDSGYTSMTSPLSDDPERQNAADSQLLDQADPLCLTDVQFLKMSHNYSKSSNLKKWSSKKLVTTHCSKTLLQLDKVLRNPSTSPNISQLVKIKIQSNKCIPHEEPKKEISPRANEHAKALHDRRVVYLGNIPSTYTTQYLREKFKRFGEIENIQIKSKESDEFDIVDHRFLASQPLNGNSSNSIKGKIQKEKKIKYFGFVTFKKIVVAREVFDKRRELCTWAGGSINYGGRREFVKEDYADFDAEANNLNPGCSYKQNQENEVDYTQLLKKEQEKRGLIASPPTSKQPQHSHHI